jgi:hypothetical protein
MAKKNKQANNHNNNNQINNTLIQENGSRNIPVKPITTINLIPAQSTSTGFFNSLTENKFGTLKKNKKIDKSQISSPTGFRVVQHVGLSNNNFEVFLFLNLIKVNYIKF